MSKKLEEKQQRRLAEERRRDEERRAALKRNLITGGIVLLVSVLVIGAIVAERNTRDANRTNVGVAADEAGCGDIEEHEDLGRDHIQPPEQPTYNSSPPTSGPHYGSPAQAAFYTTPLPAEQLVHNLEHGQIVIWYDPEASQETKDDIEAIVEQERTATLAAPYEGDLGSATFALTGWAVSQKCVKVSQEIADDFRRKYQGRSPEPIAPIFEG